MDDIDEETQEVWVKRVTIDSESHMIYKDKNSDFGPTGNEEWMAFFRDTDGNII